MSRCYNQCQNNSSGTSSGATGNSGCCNNNKGCCDSGDSCGMNIYRYCSPCRPIIPGGGGTGPTGPTGSTGPTGPTGPTGATGVGLETVQEFTPDTRYAQGDLVFYNGGLYMADINDPTGIPGLSPDYSLVTVAGPTGASGATGATAPSIYAQHGKCRNHAAFHYLKDN